jgi:DNA polymerase III epsilon subunit
MREIVLDTETIGLDPLDGHRVIEIGAVELVNRSLTGQVFHCYLCAERSMPADALAVHGLSGEFLGDKPLFGAVAYEFLAFVGDAPLVAHNAGFDIAFLNAELTRIAKPTLFCSQSHVGPQCRWRSGWQGKSCSRRFGLRDSSSIGRRALVKGAATPAGTDRRVHI